MANQHQDGAVMSMPLGGGTTTALATGQMSPGNVAVDATTVYWTNGDGTVMKVPVGGATPTPVACGEAYLPLGIALDTASVYWTDQGGTVMTLTPK